MVSSTWFRWQSKILHWCNPRFRTHIPPMLVAIVALSEIIRQEQRGYILFMKFQNGNRFSACNSKMSIFRVREIPKCGPFVRVEFRKVDLFVCEISNCGPFLCVKFQNADLFCVWNFKMWTFLALKFQNVDLFCAWNSKICNFIFGALRSKM